MKHLIVRAAATLGAIVSLPVDGQSAGAFMANPAFQGPRPARCNSTVEMQRCLAKDLRVADARMSARYNALRARLAPTAQQRLLVEQRAWLKARDRDCLAKGRGGGSAASLSIAQCWVSTTQARATALSTRSARDSVAGLYAASAFVGRWRSGEGPYMKIARRGAGLVIDNQWGLDAKDQGVFPATITAAGLVFQRNGVTETARPSKGDEIDLSALRGKRDCLMVSKEEGYCRY